MSGAFADPLRASRDQSRAYHTARSLDADAPVSRGIAVAALCWLVYNTVSTELDNMLKPPLDMEPVYKVIDSLTRGARNEVSPSACF